MRGWQAQRLASSQRLRWRMLTYAHVCSRMLTYEGLGSSSDLHHLSSAPWHAGPSNASPSERDPDTPPQSVTPPQDPATPPISLNACWCPPPIHLNACWIPPHRCRRWSSVSCIFLFLRVVFLLTTRRNQQRHPSDLEKATWWFWKHFHCSCHFVLVTREAEHATELQQSCNRAATELQQSCNRDASEMYLSFSRFIGRPDCISFSYFRTRRS